MTRSFFFALIVLALSLISTPVSAQTKVVLVNGVVHNVSLADGTGLPPRLAHSASVLVPAGKKWKLILDVGFSTPFDTFAPAPSFLAGTTTKAGKIVIAGTAFYAFLPNGEGGMHLAGTTFVPGIPLTESGSMMLLVPVGPTYNATANTFTATFALKLAVVLP